MLSLLNAFCYIPETSIGDFYFGFKESIFVNNIHLPQVLFSSSLIFFCWLFTIAILAVVRDILGACPSQIILSPSGYYYLRNIFAPSPPKISGLLLLRFYKFLRISTSLPSF
jgi:hypothetical protein